MKIEPVSFDYHGMSSTRSSAGPTCSRCFASWPTARRYLDLLAGLFMVRQLQPFALADDSRVVTPRRR
jgi:hypothetical protein